MMVSRFGKGLPMDSKVLRPITMTLPVVSCLNHLKSSGRCHGILLPAPMTRLSDMAAIALKCLWEFKSHCNWCFDSRMRVVADEFEVFEFECVNIPDRRVQFHLRQG